METAVAIIPARYGSTRLPGKALIDIEGKPLIRRVYERVSGASLVSRVVVATDDPRIARAITSFGGEAVMTSPEHKTGTDRAAEAALKTGGEIIVNVQGDEPLIDPLVIDRVIEKLREDAGISCSTAASPITDEAVYRDPNAVKVALDLQGRALYFSRSPLPFYRDGVFGGAYLHAGIYCFRREFLAIFTTLEPTPLEQAEKLEQLRMLEHGYSIGVVITGHVSIGVDTPEDLELVRRMIRNENLG
ncbi:MAG: 3-deoxy-manno-octulosonate cytidylyltransferase [Candidatus Latescibacter sp.]|nr:3-deoxy-manno-octulosonate cytidylyltransferase [Candidatus Latescibacter sp.]